MSGKKEFGKYAMEVTKQLLPYFNQYFAMPFPLSRLDQIALPPDGGDATGGWGGLVYDEEALSVRPGDQLRIHQAENIFGDSS